MDLFPLQFTAPLVVEDSPLQHVVPKDHVEVEVEYCGMNFTDNYLRLGIIRSSRFPVIMGSECCGVVTRVGHGVADLEAGQRVVCLRMMGGLFRRIVHVPRKHCFLVPDGIELRDALGLALDYLVAHVCLFELGALKQDDVVFMQSIGGGVGTAVTRLSKTVKNVRVLGTASESKHEVLQDSGVTLVFGHNDDYVQEILCLRPEGVDIIINSNGGLDIEKCCKMLKQCGTLILIGSNCTAIYPRTTIWGMLRPTWAPQTLSSAHLISKNYTVEGVNIGLLLDTQPEMMQALIARIFKLFSDGKIKVCIHDILPFEKVADGMTQLCERKNIGKIIFDLKQRPARRYEPDAFSPPENEEKSATEAPKDVSGPQ